MGGTLQVPQGTNFISDPPFQGTGPNVVQEKAADTRDHCYFPLFKKIYILSRKYCRRQIKLKPCNTPFIY